jgi:mannosyltransferase
MTLTPPRPVASPGPPAGEPRRSAPLLPAGPPSKWRRWYGRLVSWRHFDAAVVIALVVCSAALRFRTLWTSYWGDEAIAIGISSHHVGSIPHYLAYDGSPPLYYVLLHFWLELFGASPVATHTLSLLCASAAIPAGWWIGTRLFGRRVGRALAGLLTTCAYLDYYSTETRMYALLALVCLLAVGCFALAYSGQGRRYWVAAWALVVVALYLHNFALYVLASLCLVGGAFALWNRDWRRWWATVAFFGAAALAYLPWVPSFLYQEHHTGAPWAPHPLVTDFFGDSFNAVASAAWFPVGAAIVVGGLLLVRGGLRLPDVRRAGPLTVCLLVPVCTLVMAWIGAQVVNSWSPRYLGVAVVPALLGLAGALDRTRFGRLAVWVCVACLAGTTVPFVVDRTLTVDTSKSNADYTLGQLRSQLRPGDLIVSAQVTNTPVLAYDLGPTFRYATPLGLNAHPMVVDWTNLPKRLQSINAAANLAPLLAKVPVGGHVLVVNPLTWSTEETPDRYAGAVAAEGIAANQAVLDNPAFESVMTLNPPKYSNPLYPIEAVLYVRVS